MPTSNPKVSAYIPQHLYDLFTTFCDERKVSMSKGVTLLFSEYFEVGQKVNYQEGDKATELRLQDLEEKVGRLLSSFSDELPTRVNILSQQLEFLNLKVQSLEESKLSSRTESSLLESEENKLITNSENLLTPEIATVSSVPASETNKPIDKISLLSEPQEESLLKSRNSDVSSPGHLSRPLIELESEPLSIKLTREELVQRLGVTYQSFSVKKTKLHDNEKFLDWIQTKDPDGVRWIELPLKTRFKFYTPDKSTPDKLIQKLITDLKD